MIAYACDPEGNGEHWLGWGWAEQAARSFDLHLIVPSKSRAAIERHASAVGLTPHFIELPNWFRAISERMGSVGSWWRKIAWQKRAAEKVAELHAREKIALVHQTTFHTFRAPFTAASLGIPSVWGPIAGGERVPAGFDAWLGSARNTERWRVLGNRLCLVAPAVRRSLRDVDTIFVSNRTTLDFLPQSCRSKCQVVPPNTLRENEVPSLRPMPLEPKALRIIYAGNCVATRAIPLVLAAMAQLDDNLCTLTVVGEGPALEDWRRAATKFRVENRVRFTGQVDRSSLAQLYAEADVLVFPALRDAGGSALLEAMSKGLPVVCFDWAGPGEMVDASSGVKIAVRDPAQTIHELASALDRLRSDPKVRASIAAHAVERAQTYFTWEAKRRLLETTYRHLIKAS